jgi:hypothetical protein
MELPLRQWLVPASLQLLPALLAAQLLQELPLPLADWP